MTSREHIQKLSHSEEFVESRAGQNVWPQQWCPAFAARHSSMPSSPKCWFCRYADFHLTEPVALEVGICCWPEVQLE